MVKLIRVRLNSSAAIGLGYKFSRSTEVSRWNWRGLVGGLQLHELYIDFNTTRTSKLGDQAGDSKWHSLHTRSPMNH